MNFVRSLQTVQMFSPPTSAGIALLAAFWRVAQDLNRDLTITSGADGAHSGPADPHHLGNAFDVRSHDFLQSEKDSFVRQVLNYLGAVSPQDGGYVTTFFFGWLEQAGTANEHFHFQLRRGVQYLSVSNSEQVQDATQGDN